MPNKSPPSKWAEFKKQSELAEAPVTSDLKARSLSRSELGSPPDTEMELKAQRSNLGGKDTPIELEQAEEYNNKRGPNP